MTAQHAQSKAPAYVKPKAPYEDRMETYARQTRTAAVVIAWIVGIFAISSLVVGIVIGVQIGHANSSLNGTSSSCVSQGGTIPGC